jgi:molybdopterin-binding protein
MKYGAQNNIVAKVKSIKTGDVMSQVKFEVVIAKERSSVLTTDSVHSLDLEEGGTVHLIIKVMHVLPVKE